MADASAVIASTLPARPRAAPGGVRLLVAILALAALSGCDWLARRPADPPPQKAVQEEGVRLQAATMEAERRAPGLPGHEGDEARQIGRLVWFWFSRRDGAPPEGERLTQMAAFLPEGYSFGCDGGEKRICTRFREPLQGGRSLHRPGSAGDREDEGLHSSGGPPAGDRPPGPTRPRDRMGAAAGARPEAGRLMQILMSFQFPEAEEGGYTPEQLDHLAVGLAIQTRMLAQACLPGRPGHPPVTWGEILHRLRQGLWSEVRDGEGGPILDSLLIDYAEEDGPATLVLLHRGTPIQAVRILRSPRRPGCKVERAGKPGEMRRRVLQHLDQDGDGLVGPEEMAAFRRRHDPSGNDEPPT